MSDHAHDAKRLSATLEAKLLARLAVEWRGLNYRYFKSALRPPVLELCDDLPSSDRPANGHEPLARWTPQLRCVELSRAGLLARPWGEILDALTRAAVWQYIDERLNVDPRNRHPSYRRICRHLALDLESASESAANVDPKARRVVARIHKLLALARSPNQHEAETAAMTARRLMLKFNIDDTPAALDAASIPAPAPRYADPRYGYRHLGQAARRREEHDRRLAKILTMYFFVESVWLPVYLPREGRPGTVLEICGLAPNLAMATHVHDFLRAAAERLWTEHAASTDGPAGPRERLSFLAGVMAGFEDKLARQDASLREQGLVWVPAPGLEAYFRRRHPKLQYTRASTGPASASFEAGSRAGQRIVLSTPLGGEARAPSGPPRALPSGSR